MRISRNSPFTVYGGVLVTAVLLSLLSASHAASLRSPPSESALASPPGGQRLARQAVYPEDYSDESGAEEDEAALEAEAQNNAYLAQQNVGDSDEDSGEEDDGDEDGDDERRRRRRDTADGVTEKEAEAETTVAPVTVEAATASPPKNTSVLILIRDALKKVTNDLPTQQVATNALQYFQLFEHFLQQTIEQVIGDDDDEEEEAAVAAAPAQPEEAEKPATAVESSVAAAAAAAEASEPEKVAEDKPAAPEPTVATATD